MVIRDRTKVLCLALKTLRAALVLALPLSILLLWTGQHNPAGPTTMPIEQPRPQVTTAITHDFDWYAPLWQRDLKQPPIPPATVEPAAPVQSAGPLPTLLATFVDLDGRYAHLRDGNGRVQLKSVDDYLDRFRVVAIEPGKVQVEDGDGIVWLEIPKAKDQ